MKLCSLASSSSGNCIYIGNENTNILIDVGISGKKLEAGLKLIDVEPKSIKGILITHEHSDHVKGLGVIARRYKVPIYGTLKTIMKIRNQSQLGKIDPDLFIEINPDEGFLINDMFVKAVRISHDAVDPVCYTMSTGDKKVSVATDLGCYNPYIVENLKDSNILFLEANHDIKMLEVGKYPYYLKQRVLSNVGHLSNEMSGRLLKEVFHEKLEYVVLGHLSNENNVDEVAYETVISEFTENKTRELDFELLIASKFETSKLISI